MELYQLRTFVTAAKQGHLTHAAEQLHLSQPAVSAQIKALEEEWGVALFERKAAGVALTRAGEVLLSYAEKILAAAGDLRAQAKNLTGQVTGKVRFGTIVDPEFIRLGEFLAAMLKHHPMVEVEVHQRVTGEVINGVKNGELDAGFSLGSRIPEGVAAINLRNLHYRIVGPVAWKEKITPAGWKEIAALPWIRTPRISVHHQMVSEMFKDQKLEPGKVIEADNESVIINLVTAGVGLSLMREDLALAAKRAEQVILWDKAKAETTLWFIYPAPREADPVIRAMAAVVRDLWEVRE